MSHKSTGMVEECICWICTLGTVFAQCFLAAVALPLCVSRDESSVLAHSFNGLGWGHPSLEQLCFPGVPVPGLAAAEAVVCAGVPLWHAWAPSDGG